MISCELPIREYRGGEYEDYIYTVWLSWRLLERWDTFHAAVSIYNDDRVGELLAEEIACLCEWPTYVDKPVNYNSLPCAHFALAIAKFLLYGKCDGALRARIEAGSRRLLHSFILNCLNDKLSNPVTYDNRDLHNIPNILLMSGAALASVLGDEVPPRMWEKVKEVMAVLSARRFDAVSPFSEGPAYDAFLMYHLYEGAQLTGHADIFAEPFKPLLSSFVDNYITAGIPGRTDIFAPTAT